MQSSIKPREGRHELSLGFVQHLKHMSPLQGFLYNWRFTHGLRHGLQPVTPFGVKVSAIGLASERLIRN